MQAGLHNTKCVQRKVEFAKNFCEAVAFEFVLMGFFDTEAGGFRQVWMGAGDDVRLDTRAKEITSDVRRRVATSLKVRHATNTGLVLAEKTIQLTKPLWLMAHDIGYGIGIGEPIGKMVPVIAWPLDDSGAAGDHKPILQIGLSYVAEKLAKEVFPENVWNRTVFEAAAGALSINFLLMTQNCDVMHHSCPDAGGHIPETGSAFDIITRLVPGVEVDLRSLRTGVRLATSDSPRSSILPFLRSGSPWLVFVTPLPNSDPPLALVIMEGANTDHDRMSRKIFDMYGLTASERQVARGIIHGKSVADIAEETSLSVATVRSYLKQVLSKTGVSRQGQLISLYFSSVMPVMKQIADAPSQHVHEEIHARA